MLDTPKKNLLAIFSTIDLPSEMMISLFSEFARHLKSKHENIEIGNQHNSNKQIFSVTHLTDNVNLYIWLSHIMPSNINLLTGLELPRFDGYIYIVTDPFFIHFSVKTDIFVKHRQDEIRYIVNFSKTVFYSDKLLLIYLYHSDKDHMLLPELLSEEFEAFVAAGLIYEPCPVNEINEVSNLITKYFG